MSIISDMKALLETCPYLKDFALRVDYREASGEDYGIFPAGTEIVSTDMSGASILEQRFVLQANRYTHDDVARLDNCDFMENFERWLNGFNRKSVALTAGTFIEITCAGGYFEDWNEDQQCGVYRIPCCIIYEREG